MTTQENTEIRGKLSAATDERQPRKIGCLVYLWGGGAVLLILFWFNIVRSVPPRVAPEITYITEPRSVVGPEYRRSDGRFVDYRSAIEQAVSPPEMATDDNGYRLVMRAIGPMEKTSDEYTQQRYEKLGLDFIRDKPTLAFNDPYTYIHLRYEFRPEDFDEILAAMNRRQHEREQAATGLSDPMPVTLPETVASDGLQDQPDLPDEDADEDADVRANEIMDETVMAEFMIPGTALDSRGQVNSSQIWDFIARSPDLHKLPIVQEWLAANNAALNLNVEASKK
ncbi:MAG: hypothetical protein FWD31_12720, partial [Planctomycetaceae bacterium]|nr:hypothetical protein [Planctomycetaceae bacterium]